jgi:hypothetical protein
MGELSPVRCGAAACRSDPAGVRAAGRFAGVDDVAGGRGSVGEQRLGPGAQVLLTELVGGGRGGALAALRHGAGDDVSGDLLERALRVAAGELLLEPAAAWSIRGMAPR